MGKPRTEIKRYNLISRCSQLKFQKQKPGLLAPAYTGYFLQHCENLGGNSKLEWFVGFPESTVCLSGFFSET